MPDDRVNQAPEFYQLRGATERLQEGAMGFALLHGHVRLLWQPRSPLQVMPRRSLAAPATLRGECEAQSHRMTTAQQVMSDRSGEPMHDQGLGLCRFVLHVMHALLQGTFCGRLVGVRRDRSLHALMYNHHTGSAMPSFQITIRPFCAYIHPPRGSNTNSSVPTNNSLDTIICRA